jgi:hypothetical protein
MEDCSPVSTPIEVGRKLGVTDHSGRRNDCKAPYREAVGSLMYLATCTRPDLSMAVSTCARFLDSYNEESWKSVKRILRYLRGTTKFGIQYNREGNGSIIGYSDADWGGDVETGKSRSGFVFLLSSGAISWSSKLQEIVALSSTEAEYIAACEAGKEIIWFNEFLHEIGLSEDTIELRIDNKSSIELAKNPVFHKRTKHIRLRYHKIREWVQEKEFKISHVTSGEMAADFLTKPVRNDSLSSNLDRIGVKYITH